MIIPVKGQFCNSGIRWDTVLFGCLVFVSWFKLVCNLVVWGWSDEDNLKTIFANLQILHYLSDGERFYVGQTKITCYRNVSNLAKST